MSGSCAPGDHARFFEGDALREGDGNGTGSFTGTWVIRLPRRVCVTATSNMSGFCPESLIFGIEGQVYEGGYNRKKMETCYQLMNQLSNFGTYAVVCLLLYPSLWRIITCLIEMYEWTGEVPRTRGIRSDLRFTSMNCSQES